mmetsp:Transcript_59635/g.81496  ORF Transcript_59635/g.81496 Transcript_59635/m.81496 type:complete len:95 (+) Transcript_59635:206-490(+)
MVTGVKSFQDSAIIKVARFILFFFFIFIPRFVHASTCNQPSADSPFISRQNCSYMNYPGAEPSLSFRAIKHLLQFQFLKWKEELLRRIQPSSIQ